MKLKKTLSLIVMVALLITCLNTSVFAEDNTDCNVSNSEKLYGQQLLTIQNKHTLTSHVERVSYLKDVCDYFGINTNTVDYLNENTVDCLSSSEEFGFRTVNYSEQEGQRGINSEEREYDNMTLSILWGRTGTTYSIMGFQEWTDLPVMRKKDIISLDLGGGSIVSDSQSAILIYNKNGTTYTDEFDKDDSEYKGINSACVFEIDLPNSVDEIGFIISYSVIKNSTDNTITMQYFHKWSPWIFSISISYYAGICVSPSSIYTDYSLQTGTAS